MRTCLFIMHSFGGGAEFMALNLLENLSRAEFSPAVACLNHVPALAAALPQGFEPLMPSGPGLAARLANFAAVCGRARRSDIVLGTLELQSIMAAGLCGKGKAVGWLHKDLSMYFSKKSGYYKRLYSTLLGFALGRSKALACVSEGVRAAAEGLFPEQAGKLRVIPNPIDFERIRREGEAPLPPLLEECFRKPVILAVGRLAPEKAFHLLLEAHAALRGRGFDHNLCILGEGPERPFLEAEAARLGLGASFFLPGFLPPYPAMRRAAVLAVSSVFEGWPTVMLEAMALGLPVVSVNCPSGPAEILENGEYGILTAPGDSLALASGLERMLEEGEAARFRAGALTRVEDFSLANSLAAWEKLLLEPGRARAGG